MGGVDVDEDYGFGVVAGDDGLGEELPEGLFVDAAEQVAEGRIDGKGGAVGFADDELKPKDGGEGLHLDKARGEAAIGFANEAEVGGEEVGMGGLGGGSPGFGNGGEGAGEVGGVVDELKGEVDADAGHFVEEGLGEEARRFGDGEADVGSRDRVERVEHGAEGFRTESGVEVVAERRDHWGEVNAGWAGGAIEGVRGSGVRQRLVGRPVG